MRGAADLISSDPAQEASPETGWFVYGVTIASDPTPADLTGLDGARVTTLVCGAVAAVVTEVTIERPPGRGADLLAYTRVLDALVEDSTPVAPVRFGSVLEDEQAVVAEFLAPDEDYFVELLESLRGREQYVIQASYDEQHILSEVVAAEPEIAELREYTKDLPTDAAHSERVRLGELVGAAVEQRRFDDADRLLGEILPLVDAHVLRPVSGLERVVDAALLVATSQRESLEALLEALAENLHPRLRLRLVGPTAPFDFAGGL